MSFDVHDVVHHDDGFQHHEQPQVSLEPLFGAGLLSVDSGGLITAWTEQAERSFGWLRGEVIGHPLVATIVAAHHRQRDEHELERVLSGEAGSHERRLEVIAAHRDGREFTIELVLVPVPLGRAFEFSGFLDEIGSREWTPETLGHMRGRHGAVFEAAAEAYPAEGRGEPADRLRRGARAVPRAAARRAESPTESRDFESAAPEFQEPAASRSTTEEPQHRPERRALSTSPEEPQHVRPEPEHHAGAGAHDRSPLPLEAVSRTRRPGPEPRSPASGCGRRSTRRASCSRASRCSTCAATRSRTSSCCCG